MKGRLLVGKTVKRVHQGKMENTNGALVWSLEAIEFTDGSFLRFLCIEGEGEYGLDPIYPARPINERIGDRAVTR